MAVYDPSGKIRAAGGVVLEMGPTGPRVLLAHRPAYDDWSLPKGKLKRGEKARRAAVREVVEETGLICDTQGRVGEMYYRDRKRRPKCAQYWAMIPRSGQLLGAGEVDRCRWFDLSEAAERASRSGDRELLAKLAENLHCRAEADRIRIEVAAYTIVHEDEDGAWLPAGL